MKQSANTRSMPPAVQPCRSSSFLASLKEEQTLCFLASVYIIDPNPADRGWVVIQYGLLYELHDLIVVHVQDISHPLAITARSIAPFIGFYSVNGRHDRYRIGHQFEESVEIPFPVPGADQRVSQRACLRLPLVL